MFVLAWCWWFAAAPQFSRLERSFWVHASLDERPHRNYWGPAFPPSRAPDPAEVRNACRVLTGEYAANRLYLIYHKEIPIDAATRVLTVWKDSCPPGVEIVPTPVLTMYDADRTAVFTEEEFRDLAGFLKEAINPGCLAVYDVYPNRNQGKCLDILAELYPRGLIRVGLQPEERLSPPFSGAVQDTWSAFSFGKTNGNWRDAEYGRELLRGWVERRNRGLFPVAWDLIAVAWDYAPTERGEFPGYDDAERNMPLPKGRNLLAGREILLSASPERIAGFSSDLFILHENSRSATHDGPGGGFYGTLRHGEAYAGYYREPFEEIVSIYRALREGRNPFLSLVETSPEIPESELSSE